MPPERWRQIEDIFNAALEREPAVRPAFLENACRGDEALRRQVEALLREDGQDGAVPAGGSSEVSLATGFSPGFSPGSMAGPYRIGERLGVGGMGEVYRARDTRLNRTVAIKTLEARFTARFEREARAISALNHPHICTLYDIGSQDGVGYLVMEYVEGAPLKGPLPLEEALRLAIQIAGALEAAHEKGILHRDLKPGNILVSKSGVKLLDFGLAKFAATLEAPEARAAEVTVTTPLTGTGQILGTLAYMSPEQIEGKPADGRSDIFAFGLVLYEMLTGRRAFEASSQTGLMAAILKDQPPPLTELQPSIPAALDRTVRKCLAKDPARRWQTASDLRDELGWIGEGESAAPRRVARRALLPWIAGAAGLLGLIGAIGWWGPWRAPRGAAEGAFLQMDLETGLEEVSQPAISRDGTRIVFVSKGGLAIRRLDERNIAPLARTEGASSPFFSPDGRWVAFFANGKLQKIAVDGGAAVTLCDALGVHGGTWGEDDHIVVAMNSPVGLARVPAAGGAPQSLTDSKADVKDTPIYLSPQALPGGKGILFGASNGTWQGSLRVLTPHDGQKTLVENSTDGRYLASGYLVYHQRGTLFAAPMDPVRLALTGPAVPLVDGVSYSDAQADFDVSASGTLVYYGNTSRTNLNLSWLYASGRSEALLRKPGNYVTPRVSPDGTRLAVSVVAEGKQNLWVYDLSRETWTRLTSAADPDMFPCWTPDGVFLAFRSGSTLAWTRSDGSGKVERLAAVNGNVAPWSFSADGKWLTFWPVEPDSDLWIVPVERAPGTMRLGQPQPLLQQPGSKGAPAISPDGRWLAYTSNESGPFQIYVAPFAPPFGPPGTAPKDIAKGGKWQVSSEGGSAPIWSRKGGELFYQGLDRRVRVAAYRGQGDSFAAEKPRVWSERRQADIGFSPAFDVAPDGTRVLALMATEGATPETFLRVMFNVGGELRRRAPAGK